MANQRALKLKAHSEEFDSKKEDLKRLRHGLESWVSEVLNGQFGATYSPVKKTLAPYRQFHLEVEAYAPIPGVPGMALILIAAGRRIEKESDLHLEIVRLAHDNMDTIIEAVEEFCQKAGRSARLQAQFQRLLV